MAEENEEPKTEQSATPASNQNLIIGIVMGAVVLLLLLLVISQQLNKGGDSKPENKELVALRKEIEERKFRNEAMRYSSMPGVSQNPEALVSQIKSDTEALARLINVSASDAALLRTSQDSAAALARRNSDLENELRQNRAAAARVNQLEADLNAARQAAAGMVSKSQVDSLRDQLALAKAERDRLQTEFNELRATQGNMVDSNSYALIKAERDELLADNARLRAENQRLIAELAGTKLFVTQDDLSPRAVALYRELKRIENETHTTRPQIYNVINQQLKANVRESINFKSGSAQIALEHEAHLKDVAVSAPANSFFLVVGYASTSGDSKTNEELSSQRATRVASMVNYLKKQGQAVQAVYLGEGKRFGPEDSPNQVCEVWEIRP